MPGASRDRVTIDLRGIGDAVRAAGAVRRTGVAQFVRRALVMSLDLRAMAAAVPPEMGSDGQTPGMIPTRDTAKLTLRLTRPHAEALMLSAGAIGLCYCDCVGRPVANSALPQPAVERQADRAALRVQGPLACRDAPRADPRTSPNRRLCSRPSIGAAWKPALKPLRAPPHVGRRPDFKPPAPAAAWPVRRPRGGRSAGTRSRRRASARDRTGCGRPPPPAGAAEGACARSRASGRPSTR